MADLGRLIESIEGAGGSTAEHYALVGDAFWAIKPNYVDNRAFLAMLDAYAYESAALSILAKGWTWGLTVDPAKGAVAYVNGGNRAEAASAALALTAACLRAHVAEKANV